MTSEFDDMRDWWLTATRKQKEFFVTEMKVNTRRRQKSFSPRHPLTGNPSRETFRNEVDAQIAQIDWLVRYATRRDT
jgi:hypothetical protein